MIIVDTNVFRGSFQDANRNAVVVEVRHEAADAEECSHPLFRRAIVLALLMYSLQYYVLLTQHDN